MIAPSSVCNAYFASSSISSLGRMIWKSAPNGQTLPLICPRTSPPMMGTMRRTPWPTSPALATSAILAVMVKTYLVLSVGVIGDTGRHGFEHALFLKPQHGFLDHALPRHALRQPGCEQREHDQDHQPD